MGTQVITTMNARLFQAGTTGDFGFFGTESDIRFHIERRNMEGANGTLQISSNPQLVVRALGSTIRIDRLSLDRKIFSVCHLLA